MTTGVLPSRRRPSWPELPAPVRAAVEERLGATVTGWTSHEGGYSPGLASTLRTDERAVFVRLALHIGEHEIAPGVLPEVADELPTSCTATLAGERPEGLATLDPWFTTHLERLADLERHAPDAVDGTRLVHRDLRADNALVLVAGTEHGPSGRDRPAALAVD